MKLGLFSMAFGPVVASNDPTSWLAGMFERLAPRSGQVVNPDTALKVAAVYRAINIVANSFAVLPVRVVRTISAGRQILPTHSVARLLRRPNSLQTSSAWRRLAMSHVLAFGNSVSLIVRDKAARPLEMVPLNPNFVEMKVSESGAVTYHVRDAVTPNAIDVFPAADVVHVAALTYDLGWGRSPISAMAEAIGLSLAAEQYGANFFGQGVTAHNYITGPNALNKETREALQKELQGGWHGPANAHKMRVLANGLEIKTIGLPPEDLQMLQTRKFQLGEIARTFGVPPHKLGDLERATFSNIEHQAIEFVQDTVLPWVTAWEQELARKLFRDGEQDDHAIKFNFDVLLRGDSQARAEFYFKACGGPWMSPNEVRELEELNAADGGDDIRSPLNMGAMSAKGV